jgi:hypothetical protein
MRTRTKYQSKPAAMRHVLLLLFRSKQSKCCSEEEGRGPQIIVLPRTALNKHLGFRGDPSLSLLLCLKGDKDFRAKRTKIN